jgi:hypothetical protein
MVIEYHRGDVPTAIPHQKRRYSMSRSVLMSSWAVILLLACESGTGPQSSTDGEDAAPLGPEFAAVPNPSFQPFAFTVPTCGEPVDVSGTFHEVVQFFVGPSGKQHFRFHINAKGTGVGQVTGARYQWNDRLFDITNIAPSQTFTFILNDYTRLIGQGGALDLRLAVQNKITVTPAGTIVVDRLVVRAVCD